jgi:hypothetical protein
VNLRNKDVSLVLPWTAAFLGSIWSFPRRWQRWMERATGRDLRKKLAQHDQALRWLIEEAQSVRIAQVAEGNLLSVTLQRLKNRGADPELLQLTGDCLQADRRFRPANAGEVLERLNRLLDSFDAESRTVELTATDREPRPTEAVQ